MNRGKTKHKVWSGEDVGKDVGRDDGKGCSGQYDGQLKGESYKYCWRAKWERACSSDNTSCCYADHTLQMREQRSSTSTWLTRWKLREIHRVCAGCLLAKAKAGEEAELKSCGGNPKQVGCPDKRIRQDKVAIAKPAHAVAKGGL